MSRSQSIGFSQRIQLDWLEHTAQAHAAGAARDDISLALQAMLRDKQSVGGTAERGSREKTITILLKCWVAVPPCLGSLRDRATELIRALPQRDHLALHWGMCSAAYHFLGLVAEATARRLLRMFVDWGVLTETEKKGVYGRGQVQRVDRADLAAWLVEAGLTASGGGPIALSSLSRWPMLFPFEIAAPVSGMVNRSGNLTLLQYEGGSPALTLRGAGCETSGKAAKG